MLEDMGRRILATFELGRRLAGEDLLHHGQRRAGDLAEAVEHVAGDHHGAVVIFETNDAFQGFQAIGRFTQADQGFGSRRDHGGGPVLQGGLQGRLGVGGLRTKDRATLGSPPAHGFAGVAQGGDELRQVGRVAIRGAAGQRIDLLDIPGARGMRGVVAFERRTFGQQAVVLDAKGLPEERGAHLLERRAVLRGRREVMDAVGVALHVVELLGWLRPPELRRGGGQASGGGLAGPGLIATRLELVFETLHVRQVRTEVADVKITGTSHAAHHVVARIHAVARREDELVGRRLGRTGHRPALHVLGDLQAGEREHRRGEIDEVHRILDARPRGGRGEMTPLGRVVDDERHVHAALLQEALAAREHAAVVAVIEDDGVLREAVLLQVTQLGGDLPIHDEHVIIITRPVGADLRGVRLIGRDADLGRLQRDEIKIQLLLREQAALVRHLVVEDAEERLGLVLVAAPVGLLTLGGPGVLDADRGIVICLRVVGGEVARLAKQRRETTEPRRDDALGAHVLGRAAGLRAHARDDVETRRRADRTGEAAFVDHPFAGELVERGRAGELVSVAAQEGVVVLAHQAEDVRPIRLGGAQRGDAEEKQDGEDGAAHGVPRLNPAAGRWEDPKASGRSEAGRGDLGVERDPEDDVEREGQPEGQAEVQRGVGFGDGEPEHRRHGDIGGAGGQGHQQSAVAGG